MFSLSNTSLSSFINTNISSNNSSLTLFLFTSICDDGSPFWDQNLSWYTDYPTLTSCFIDTGLSWPPILLLWLLCPYMLYEYLICCKHRPSIPLNCYNVTKISAAILMVFVGLCRVIHTMVIFFSQDDNHLQYFITKAHLLSVCLTSITYILFVSFLYLQRRHGFVNCGCNWFYLLSLVILNALVIATGRQYRPSNLMIYIYIEYSLQILLFLMSSFADDVPNIEEIIFSTNDADRTSSTLEIIQKKGQENEYTKKKNKSKRVKLCPKEMASVSSKLTFWWFNSLAIEGWRRPLTTDDLWDLPSCNHSGYLFKIFNNLWRHPSFMDNRDKVNKTKMSENDYCSTNESINKSINSKSSSMTTQVSKVNLWIMFAKMFWIYFFFPSFARLATDLLQLVNPIVLKFMINFTTDRKSPLWQGIFYSCIFMLTNIFQSLSSAYQQHRMAVLSMRIKSVLISTIYRKSLVLAMDAKKSYTTGEIVNLMAVDSQRFTELIPWISFLWSAPLQIFIGMFLLWKELGPSVIGGIILMVAIIPVNLFVANQVRRIQRNQMSLKDKRLKAISEMLNGMKVLKLYAWEKAFIQNISNIRLQELKYIKRSGLVSAIFVCFGSCSPFLVSIVTFIIYIFVSGNTLTAEKAFVSISLFNLLRIPLLMLPNMISSLILTIVSMKRINRFLNQDEIQDYVTRYPMKNEAVLVKNASFSWDAIEDAKDSKNDINYHHLTLIDITVTIPKKKLIAVVGPVGSGKSSFLYALLGEMHKYQGSLNIDRDQRLAYVPQQAWIQNLSLRDNILFGLPYDQKKYDQVIRACSLESDFEMLSGGDQTEIGEKGINLSGGQKQRVSIARACYSDSDLFLFDDPLSAVDSHVGKHIFEEVLSSDRGMLRNKTRVLVTNALYVLPLVDQVILIKNGRIEDVGTYQKLLDTNESFQELINSYKQTNQDEDKDDIIQSDEANIVCGSIMVEKEDELEKSQERVIEAKLLEQMKCLPSSISKNVDFSDSIRRQLSRKNTKMSMKQKSQSQAPAENVIKLVEAENVETGQISLTVYKKFITALSPLWFILIMINYIGSAGSSAASNFWLSIWTDRVEQDPENSSRIDNSLIYFIIGFFQVIFVIMGWLAITFGTLNASRKLHHKLLSNIVHAPMHFFDTTPLGRIINRFSKDIDVLDNYIQLIMRVLLNNTLQVIATLVIISSKTPIFMAFVVPFITLYFFIQRFYVSTSRQLKRIESISRSPIFTHFSETIQGVSTIKAYGALQRFIEESNRRVDNNQRCFYPSQVANCWLQVRLEFLANCLIFFASFLATITKETLTGSSIGLSLSYALNITLSLNWCVRMFAEMENNIISVERISEYTDVDPEAPWHLDQIDKALPNGWPKQGVIKFHQYATRYRPGLDLVLKGIDLSIQEGEKIGIVGRTGAGKSSLTLALFRIIESSQGMISIDGVNISKLGLHKLRSLITIIPQDPVLFCGTLRFNLDPFNNYTDEQLWSVLELSHLKSFVQSLESGLKYQVAEAGENFSVGQRQLICLARALLRRTKVLVLDEATAAVDMETDALIQSTIRQEFSNCTVLTIAHRLHTILDSDRVLVLDAGHIVEFDSPKTLLGNNQSIFYSLAKDAGVV